MNADAWIQLTNVAGRELALKADAIVGIEEGVHDRRLVHVRGNDEPFTVQDSSVAIRMRIEATRASRPLTQLFGEGSRPV